MTEQSDRPFVLIACDERGLPVEQQGAASRLRDEECDDHDPERGRRKAREEPSIAALKAIDQCWEEPNAERIEPRKDGGDDAGDDDLAPRLRLEARPGGPNDATN